MKKLSPRYINAHTHISNSGWKDDNPLFVLEDWVVEKYGVIWNWSTIYLLTSRGLRNVVNNHKPVISDLVKNSVYIVAKIDGEYCVFTYNTQTRFRTIKDLKAYASHLKSVIIG